MALKLDILANTRQFVGEMKKAGASTEDISNSLDDMARDGAQAGDKLERTFRDMTRDAQRADSAVEDIGTSGGSSLRRLGDVGSDVSGELRQNLGETFSSFRGELSDLPQIAQDTLGGLAGAGALGGIVGLAVTAAGAAGLGLITAEMQKQQEEAKILRDRIGGVYSGLAEDGQTYLDTAALISEANSLMFDSDRADEWKRVQSDALQLGLEQSTVIAANAGDLKSQEEVQKRINELTDELNNKPRQQGFEGTAEWDKEKKNLDDISGRWDTLIGVTQEYNDKLAASKEVAANLHEQERDQIQRTRDASVAHYEAMAQTYAKPIKAVVEFEVDDAKWRNWRPSPKTAQVSVSGGVGGGRREVWQ